MLTCGNNLISCGNDLVSCGNDLLTCGNDFLSRGNDLLSCGNQIETCKENSPFQGSVPNCCDMLQKLLLIWDGKEKENIGGNEFFLFFNLLVILSY